MIAGGSDWLEVPSIFARERPLTRAGAPKGAVPDSCLKHFAFTLIHIQRAL